MSTHADFETTVRQEEQRLLSLYHTPGQALIELINGSSDHLPRSVRESIAASLRKKIHGE